MFERHIIILKSHHRIKNASSPQFATDTQYTHVHEHMICSTRRRRKERERESESERERVKRIGAYSINAHVAVWRHFAKPRTYTHRHSRTYLYTVRSERTMTREISLLPTFPWAKLKLFFSTCSSAIRYTAIDTDQQKKTVCVSVRVFQKVFILPLFGRIHRKNAYYRNPQYFGSFCAYILLSSGPRNFIH